jgi:hypothetical protein
MERFYHDPTHLRVDADGSTVYLSEYFDWYGEDFLLWLEQEKGMENPGVLDYVKLTAPAELTRDVGDDATVEFIEYDWRLNDQNAEWANLRREQQRTQ